MTPVEDRIADLLYPLTDFYSSAGAAPPRVEVIDGAAMPQPYRALLAHENDMTPTLESFCGEPIHLRLLQVRQTPEALYRQVLLVPNGDDAPIEFGAIRINLPRFEAAPRKLILEGYRPLGTILAQHRIVHQSRPSAFFSLEPDALIRGAFDLDEAPTLYGRHNVIYDEDDQPLAEVVEILPPLDDEPRNARKARK